MANPAVRSGNMGSPDRNCVVWPKAVCAVLLDCRHVLPKERLFAGVPDGQLTYAKFQC